MTMKLQFLVEMRREKSLGGLYKHVSGMLNIKLTFKGWRGPGLACDIWRMHDISRHISQELLLLVLPLVVLATGILNDLP